ncbi:tetrapyrrole methylase family protein / MazG family protein [Anaerosphaera aminiphila DSM 21120]|uniref:Tetrapyrrole methylase family protein / MazG family protein n=1 Tax=Anaerosphaera aminiphila DSM 21120 TaxID=1120995 RepID=A0A1M5R1S2_9FIRM|nr:MazG nucleotide pyrophosphohydrolase domain-containing protein [Anaerosphaera aminiphila]SHH20111.1 tetrapyrrole methylase family protein / MazG family protein [Anaerosphaera aminiphila DSM 21120]
MINIVGLGATDKYGLTLEAVEIIANGNKNFARTKEHEAMEYFSEKDIEYSTFDYLYETKASFEEVYDEIVDILLRESKDCDINYFVPGNPLIAERTVVKLLERTEDYNLIMGMSFIEPMLRAVKRDPSRALILLDGDDFNPLYINVHSDVLITQVYNRRIAVDLKLSLSEIYSDEYYIYLVTDAGLKSEDVNYIPIFELDRVDNINHQTAIYIPSSEEIKSLSDIVTLLEKNELDIKHSAGKDEFDNFLNSTLNILNKIIEINREGSYYIYEIFDEMYKKVEENRDFHKLSVEKINDIGYNYNSLEEINNKEFIDELIDSDTEVIKRTVEVIDKVTSIGFVWNDVEGVLEKVAEELDELKSALEEKNPVEISEEMGDLIFTCLNLCRFLKLDVKDVLNSTVDKFVNRFSIMSKLASQRNLNLTALDLPSLDKLYNEAKEILKSIN